MYSKIVSNTITRVSFLLAIVVLGSLSAQDSAADPSTPQEVVVGVPTLLSGDWAGLGENIVNTVQTYQKHYGRHPLKFIFEDAKISGADGLKAYQKLISGDHVAVLIGATSSNGTMAAAGLINSSRTPMITPVTGGSNVDHAGAWIFRLGNSDILNGQQQANILKTHSIGKVALLSEETEYTLDIAKSFTSTFQSLGGQLVYSDTFLPTTTDFRSQIGALLRTKPEALFIPTQTGSALALILTQLSQLGGFSGEIHTTFTAADNPDARKLAIEKFKGVFYLAPAYEKASARLKEFLEHYRQDHKRDPLITFHTAATVDALDLLQNYLDRSKQFNRDEFSAFLLQTKNYHGLLGTFSLDENGNANTGFEPARIE